MAFPKHAYANLEAPDERAFAAGDPRGFLAQFDRGAIIDEIQRVPELTSYLQGLIDDNPRHGNWILTGSQNLTMMASVLETTFIAFRLQPYFGNIGKRLIKTPKLHFYDTGLLCWLLGIRDPAQLRLHPLHGTILHG